MKTVQISQEEYEQFQAQSNQLKAQDSYISELEQREKFLIEQIKILTNARFG